MPLKISLKPDERMIVNGAIIRNGSSQRQAILIENTASILRQCDIMQEAQARQTVSGDIYFKMQACLIDKSVSDTLLPEIHSSIARLAGAVRSEYFEALMTAGTQISCGRYYKAMQAMRPVLKYEESLNLAVSQKTEGPEP